MVWAEYLPSAVFRSPSPPPKGNQPVALKISSLTVPAGILNLRLTTTILFFVAAGVSLTTFNSGVPFNQNGATVAPGTSTGVPVSDPAAAAALDALRGNGLPKMKGNSILK